MTTSQNDDKPLVILSPKFKAFLRTRASVEFLEGTTAAGKTTVGIPKFMIRVAESSKRIHLLCAKTIGILEKNILNGDVGLLAQYRGVAEYNSNGGGDVRLPHIAYQTPNGEKIIYLAGYGDRTKWQDVLGGQYGCVMIDEINIADIEFVREIFHRREYLIATLNPDDPGLPVYEEFINRSRPLKRYVGDYPAELLSQICAEKVKGWIHWYFTFYDNAALTPQQIQDKIDSVPKGTKMFKNKIQGLRGRATGLVFDLLDKHIITAEQAKRFSYVQFSCGVDTSYSRRSDDTIAFIFTGITQERIKVTLAEEVYNNRDIVRRGGRALAPSDIPPLLVAFLERNRKRWVPGGDAYARDVYIDSADQATLNECLKYNDEVGSLYDFYNSWKKLTIIDRIQLQQGWMKPTTEPEIIEGVPVYADYLIVDECTTNIHELNLYSWKEDKNGTKPKSEPEDANDHTINADQYSWIPNKQMIGRMEVKR
jgi:hypothetical protein